LEGEALSFTGANGLVRRTLHDARSATAVADARPAYAAGVRAALATVLPLILAPYLPPGAGTWVSLSGLNTAIMDKGGPYRTRAHILSALTVASAVAAIVGSLISGHVILAASLTFVLAMLCGLVRAWPDFGPGFGVTILVTYAIALAVPAASFQAAALRGLWIIVGGLWTILLATLLWPLRPYRPVRLRVAECYRAIARFASAHGDQLSAGGADEPASLTHRIVTVRTAIENARTALAVSRLGRAAESRRGERLLVLHEIADQSFAHLIALLEETAAAPESDAALLNVIIPAQLRDIAATFDAISGAIEAERDLPRVPVPWQGDIVRDTAPGAAELFDRLADYATSAAALAASLNTGDRVEDATDRIDIAEPAPAPVLFSLSAIIRPDSSVLHHAVRIAVVTTAAVLLTELLGLNHGYWVTLTAVVILQPFAAATRQKAFQRIVGTVLGGVAAAALTAVFHGYVAILVLIGLFTMLCVTLLPLNYGAYAVLGTPAFILLAEASAGDWHLAGLRIINTLIGGTLALLGANLLWPGEERNRLPEFVAAALRANRVFFDRAVEMLGRGDANVGVLRDARREVARAAFNAEESFQRLLSEHRGPPDRLEAVMTVLVYTRRIAASIASLAVVAHPPESGQPLERFARITDEVFDDLAGAVAEGRTPASFPRISGSALPSAGELPIVHQRLVRLARQLRLMHDAIDRWMGDQATPVLIADATRSANKSTSSTVV
jgi:uncharacterized membrane protein YccC